MDTISRRRIIHRAAKARGSLRDLARAIGCHEVHLSHWFAGRENFGPEKLKRLREELPDVPAEVWLEAILEEVAQ